MRRSLAPSGCPVTINWRCALNLTTFDHTSSQRSQPKKLLFDTFKLYISHQIIKMNVAFLLLSLSMFLFLQLGAASPAAFHQMTRRQESRRNDQEIFSNYIDENDFESPEPVPRSTVCAYYNKNDECHKSNDGCGQQYKTCDKYQTRCYTVLKGNEIDLQGCWAPSSTDCNQVQCLGRQLTFRSTQPFSFCCCSGDNCNEQYSIGNDIPMRH